MKKNGTTRQRTSTRAAPRKISKGHRGRFQTFFKSNPIPSSVFQKVGDDFILTDYNEATVEFTQGRVSEYVGKTAREIYAERPQVLAGIERCFAEKQTVQYESAYRLVSTGAERVLIFTFAYVPPDSVLLHLEDMTERRRAESELQQANSLLEARVAERTARLEAANQQLEELNVQLEEEIAERLQLEEVLRESERKFSLVFEKAAFAAALSTLPNGVLVDVNEAWVKIFGYSKAEAIGKSTLELNVNPDREARARILTQLQEQGSARWQEMTLHMKSGEWRTFLTNMDLVDIGGQKFVLNTTQDITERKRIEQALRQSEEKYRDLVENANSIILRMDRNGRLLFANEYALRFFGYVQNELLGQDVRILVPPIDSGGRNLEEMASAILEAPDEFTENINQNIRKNGERVWVSWRNKGIRDSQGNLIGNLAIGQDITERKRAEAEQERLRQDLERRTLELEAANKELQAFTYSVSHDLRGPLNLIEQFARLMADEYASLLPEHGQHLLHLIQVNSTAMNSLAEDVLTLTRMNQQAINRSAVSMLDLVRQALARFQEECAGRQVEITLGELPPASGDPVLLEQVWHNLISNALKFTRICSVARIEIDSLQESGRTIYLVKDNGTGFNMAHSDRLFRAFQRLHHPEDFEGNGLGLAIVEGIIRRHGGQVWAQAQVGDGATFYFTVE